MLQLNEHIEEIAGAATSGTITPLLIINGFVDNLIGAAVVAVVSGAVGTIVSFYVKRYLTKKHNERP